MIHKTIKQTNKKTRYTVREHTFSTHNRQIHLFPQDQSNLIPLMESKPSMRKKNVCVWPQLLSNNGIVGTLR